MTHNGMVTEYKDETEYSAGRKKLLFLSIHEKNSCRLSSNGQNFHPSSSTQETRIVTSDYSNIKYTNIK